MRSKAAGGLLLGLCALAAQAQTAAVTAPDTTPAIVRETPSGVERLVYLSLTNPGTETLGGLVLRYEVAGAECEREILDLPPGEVRDTLWLAEPAPATIHATLVSGQETLWSGELAIARPAEEVRIPRSPCVKVGDLRPLMLRGTNYYPRSQPWPGLWRAMDPAAFEAELTELDGLHVNCLRTFCNFDSDAGLHRLDGSFTPGLLSRVNDLLTAMDRHRMKLVLCIGSAGPMADLTMQRRFFRTGVEPFIHDGRILMWDLINEPGGSDGPKASPELAHWIQAMYEELGRLDSEHILTVGLCWQFDQLWDLGVKPPVGQFHQYSGAVGVQPAGEPPVRNVADDLRRIAGTIDSRPLLIGEFGYASVPDEARKDASEERQLEITRWVIEGVEDAAASGVNLVGVMNWCAFHFAPDWMGKGEQAFGVIRLDGSLKPAGEFLRDTYARWRERVQAPWEG